MKEIEDKNKELEEKIDLLSEKILQEKNILKKYKMVIECKMVQAKLDRNIEIARVEEAFQEKKEKFKNTSRQERLALIKQKSKLGKEIRELEEKLKANMNSNFELSESVFNQDNTDIVNQIEELKRKKKETEKELKKIKNRHEDKEFEFEEEEKSLAVRKRWEILFKISSFVKSTVSGIMEFIDEGGIKKIIDERKEKRKIKDEKNERIKQIREESDAQIAAIKEECQKKIEAILGIGAKMEDEIRIAYAGKSSTEKTNAIEEKGEKTEENKNTDGVKVPWLEKRLAEIQKNAQNNNNNNHEEDISTENNNTSDGKEILEELRQYIKEENSEEKFDKKTIEKLCEQFPELKKMMETKEQFVNDSANSVKSDKTGLSEIGEKQERIEGASACIDTLQREIDALKKVNELWKEIGDSYNQKEKEEEEEKRIIDVDCREVEDGRDEL